MVGRVRDAVTHAVSEGRWFIFYERQRPCGPIDTICRVLRNLDELRTQMTASAPVSCYRGRNDQ